MEILKLNETPVRTSRNFKINNIKLEDIILPKGVKKFNNVIIENKHSIIDENLSLQQFVYGLGEDIEKNILENTNHKLNIKVDGHDEDINIIYNFDEQNLELINQIQVEAIGNINLTIQYNSATEKPCFHNGKFKIIAREDSNVNVTIINLLNSETNNFEAIENDIYANANVRYTIIDIGGKNSISNYYSNIVGKYGTNDLKTIYLGTDNQLKDINYIAELKAEKTNIDIDVQGALNGNSRKNFKGTIDFKKGAIKSKGNENEYCLLLSDKAKSIALPMLLCTEHDVEGNHSTASGKANLEQLFYIMTRGLSYKEAIKLIVKANFNKIIKRINNDNIRENIIKEIDRRLN